VALQLDMMEHTTRQSTNYLEEHTERVSVSILTS
jgi:hypothetical protein